MVWGAGLDVERFHADPPEPGSDGNGRELGTIIGADIIWRAMPDEQFRQAMKRVVGLEFALDDDGQAPPGELVDDRQHAERPAVMRPVPDEVIAPGVIGPTGPEPDA